MAVKSPALFRSFPATSSLALGNQFVAITSGISRRDLQDRSLKVDRVLRPLAQNPDIQFFLIPVQWFYRLATSVSCPLGKKQKLLIFEK